MTLIRKSAAFFGAMVWLLTAQVGLAGEETFTSKLGFTLDVPEGYKLKDQTVGGNIWLQLNHEKNYAHGIVVVEKSTLTQTRSAWAEKQKRKLLNGYSEGYDWKYKRDDSKTYVLIFKGLNKTLASIEKFTVRINNGRKTRYFHQTVFNLPRSRSWITVIVYHGNNKKIKT